MLLQKLVRSKHLVMHFSLHDLMFDVHLQVRSMLDRQYMPDFKQTIDHFVVHTGGRAVIEEVQRGLKLQPADVQPSKETLHRFGNTCCAAVFYVLANIEAKVKMAVPHWYIKQTVEKSIPLCSYYELCRWAFVRGVLCG